MTSSATDHVMARITDAVTEFRSGDTDSARTALVALWAELGPAGDPLHRCALAHYLADTYDDPAEALVWDLRALDAADVLTDTRLHAHDASLRVAGFYPSLHLNLADNFRRLGSFPAARRHLDVAGESLGTLAADDYGALIRTAVAEVTELVAAGDTTRRPTH
ncbi:hypothetical protein [Nocardia rhizosphaerae]|uniref:Tetratricopeptide repeat protein n=1 Tax=Nocardia rhizosphaerae TaxID=1691571 RepID=A0ABV8LCX0_9NOCA